MNIFYHNNSNVIEVQGLRNAITEEYVNDADITATMTDLEGNELDGETWPLTLTATGSLGVYRVVASDVDTAGLEQGVLIISIQGDYQARLEQVVDFRTRIN